jgi:hypothetical protein
MVTGGVDVQGIAVLTHTFGHAQIRSVRAVFLTTFEVKMNVSFQIFLLLGGGFDLDETLVGGSDKFLADFAMDAAAAGMTLE